MMSSEPSPSSPAAAKAPAPPIVGAEPKPTRVMALLNQKGGVGKTTTSVNLAASFARMKRSTLLIDLDPQANATLHLGVNPDEIESSIYTLLLDPAVSADEAIIPAREHLALLPAKVDLAAAESELAQAPDGRHRLKRIIAALCTRYEYVLIDCPPSLGLLSINAMAAAREIVVPMQAHFLALQGVGKLLETVSMMSRTVNPKLCVSGVILCMHDEHSTHCREVVADLETFFEEARKQMTPWRWARVFRPAIRRNIKLAECPSFGKTVFEYARWCPGALDYQALAETFVNDWERALARQTAPTQSDGNAPDPEVVVRTRAESGVRH